jgi:TolA-binding protein
MDRSTTVVSVLLAPAAPVRLAITSLAKRRHHLLKDLRLFVLTSPRQRLLFDCNKMKVRSSASESTGEKVERKAGAQAGRTLEPRVGSTATPAAARAASSVPPATGTQPPSPADQQLTHFEQGVNLFQQAGFAAARQAFQQAMQGPDTAVAHAAELRVRICEQRLSTVAPVLESAEDLYNYSVTLINQRRLEEAEPLLQRAVQSSPDSDHIHYALGVCRGLKGDLTAACESFRRAIELQPGNRASLRNDPELYELTRRPPVSELLG